MNLVIRKIALYAKLTLFIASALIVGLVVFMNRHHQVTVWFLGTYESVNVLWVMLWTAGGSLASWWILSITRSTWRDMRELRRADDEQQKKDELDRRARELADAEKRVDEKLNLAIRRESES